MQMILGQRSSRRKEETEREKSKKRLILTKLEEKIETFRQMITLDNFLLQSKTLPEVNLHPKEIDLTLY
jgi:hypothetical protein